MTIPVLKHTYPLLGRNGKLLEKRLIITPIKYGLLYNWNAAFGGSPIANTGWHVPINDEFYTMIHFLDPLGDRGINVAGALCKDVGLTYWNDALGTNTSRFTARGGGVRDASGTFLYIKDLTQFWISTSFDLPTVKSVAQIYSSADSFNVPQLGHGSTTTSVLSGISVRLLKDSTTLTNGQTGIYIGNDGKVYDTICIGTQEWLTHNLVETKYQDGSAITNVTDATAWSGLSTGAWCYYNNDSANM